MIGEDRLRLRLVGLAQDGLGPIQMLFLDLDHRQENREPGVLGMELQALLDERPSLVRFLVLQGVAGCGQQHVGVIRRKLDRHLEVAGLIDPLGRRREFSVILVTVQVGESRARIALEHFVDRLVRLLGLLAEIAPPQLREFHVGREAGGVVVDRLLVRLLGVLEFRQAGVLHSASISSISALFGSMPSLPGSVAFVRYFSYSANR